MILYARRRAKYDRDGELGPLRTVLFASWSAVMLETATAAAVELSDTLLGMIGAVDGSALPSIAVFVGAVVFKNGFGRAAAVPARRRMLENFMLVV